MMQLDRLLSNCELKNRHLPAIMVMRRTHFAILCVWLTSAFAFVLQDILDHRRQKCPQWRVLSESSSLGDNIPDDAIVGEILQVAIEASNAACSIIKDNADGSSVVEKKATSRDLLSKTSML